MINYYNKNNTIAELYNATKDMVLVFSIAFNEGGSPDVGVRKSGEIGKHDPRADSMITNDGEVWLIAGDIVDAKKAMRITNVSRVYATPIEDLRVHVRAQALMTTGIEQVDLGFHKVKARYMLTPECGQLVIE